VVAESAVIESAAKAFIVYTLREKKYFTVSIYDTYYIHTSHNSYMCI
jgi:hypothetical protein